MGKRKLSVALGVALLATLLGPTSAAPASAGPCSGGTRAMETVSLRMFHIESEATKQVYKIGDTAVFHTTVVRPAEEDPLNMGIPTDGVDPSPAADVNVGVGLLIGDVFLPGFARTDANGHAKIKIKIEKYVKPGAADAAFYAWNVVQDTPCLRIEENGFRAYMEMFEVKK